MAEPGKKTHTLMLDNRSRLSLTGVEDVSGFNEEAVSVRTTDGTLIIRRRQHRLYAVSRQRQRQKHALAPVPLIWSSAFRSSPPLFYGRLF